MIWLSKLTKLPYNSKSSPTMMPTVVRYIFAKKLLNNVAEKLVKFKFFLYLCTSK